MAGIQKLLHFSIGKRAAVETTARVVVAAENATMPSQKTDSHLSHCYFCIRASFTIRLELQTEFAHRTGVAMVSFPASNLDYASP